MFIPCINQKESLKKYAIRYLNQYKHKIDTVFINSENRKTFKPHVLILNITDKVDLQKDEKSVALSNLCIYYTWKNIKSSYNGNEFKISTPTWNDKFELPEGSYSVSDMQDYSEYILKKQGENTDNPSIKTYVNKIENIIYF